MQCPRCGKTVQPGVVACPFCGIAMARPNPSQSVAMPASAAALSQVYDSEQRRNRIIGISVAVVALLAILGVAAFKGLQALGFGAKENDARALAVKGEAPDTNLLSAVGKPAPPVLDKPHQAPVTMPKDIYDWLEHLRKTEEARVSLTTEQLSTAMIEYAKSRVHGGVDALKDLMNGVDDPSAELRPPTEGLTKVLKELHSESRDLITRFDSYPPPPECQPIRDAYYEALSETTGMLGDLSDHLAAEDMSGLMSMKGTSAGNIDANAIKANRLVGEICDKYNTRRWFTIKGDIGSDNMMGMPSL